MLVHGRHGPELAAYCAAITCGSVGLTTRTILSTDNLIALQKKEALYNKDSVPVIQPVAIGEVCRRLVGLRVFHPRCKKYGPELVAPTVDNMLACYRLSRAQARDFPPQPE